jgi:quercetin dioxygenase-like cupin family protein
LFGVVLIFGEERRPILVHKNVLQRFATGALITMTSAVMLFAASALTPGTAAATPTIGASAVTLSKQTVGGKDYIVSDITLAPNGSTGWHTHQGEIYGVITAGTLTHYESDCNVDGVYNVGDPIRDPTGPDHVHIARNLGTVPVVLRVTYIDPAGAPTADSVPNPGCEFS